MGFFIAAGIFLLLGGCIAIKNWRRSKRWLRARAVGQVRKTYVHRGFEGEKSLRDQVRFRFTDSRGIMRSFDIHDYSGFRDDELEIQVFYDPENPRKALINTARDIYGWALGCMLIGLWLLVFGYLATK